MGQRDTAGPESLIGKIYVVLDWGRAWVRGMPGISEELPPLGRVAGRFRVDTNDIRVGPCKKERNL